MQSYPEGKSKTAMLPDETVDGMLKPSIINETFSSYVNLLKDFAEKMPNIGQYDEAYTVSSALATTSDNPFKTFPPTRWSYDVIREEEASRKSKISQLRNKEANLRIL